MKGRKRFTVGVMIHYLDNDYSKILLRGLTLAAEEMDVNLVIMPGRSLNSQLNDLKNTAYEYQYNTIYSYATKENIDALIVSAGTVGQFVTREEFKQFLDGFEDIPIVTIENIVRGYPCIRLSSDGIKDIVNHLITEHGRRKIAFVSGPKGNTDAEERLSHYRRALEENGIEYDPDMVVYGRFSEYCVELVGELLDRKKGEIDAICFANDMMCKGGYTAIAQRGLVVGKDISVTGYDDSEVATTLTPQLTTIRADASLLGRRALVEAVKLAEGKQTEDFIEISSSVVKRQSCGCSDFFDNLRDKCSEHLKNASVKELASEIVKEYIHGGTIAEYDVIGELETIIAAFFEYVINDDENDPTDQRDIFNGLLSKDLIDILSPSTFIDLLKVVRYVSSSLCGDNYEKILAIHNVIEYGFDVAADYLLVQNAEKMNDSLFTNFLINNIAKDMLVSSENEGDGYKSLVENFPRMHMKSGYIYTYDEPALFGRENDWKRPENLNLKAYYDSDSAVAVPADKQSVKSGECLSNDNFSDRRRTFILFPLFINEENYGIIAAEMQFEYYPYIYSIAPQICTAIKLTDLVRRLESSLDAATARNNQLNRISMHDELTGIFNRRGFYESANSIFTSRDNEGKKGVLIFADLDNLKKINDSFGHEEGDFAIITAAGYLQKGLRNTDVVARIGGDEFAAFAIFEDESIILTLPSRIKGIIQKYNEGSDKEYNVTMSIGVYELTCSPSEKIQMYMDKADLLLYEDKKKKSTCIFKNQ